MYAKNIEELIIYQISFLLSQEIEKLVKSIPHHWGIEDVKQIIRSSSSAPSNIAEGFTQRFYPKQFIKYLNIALGSSEETKNHLKKLNNSSHIGSEDFDNYFRGYKDLSVRIVNFISYLKEKHNITN